MSLPKGIAHLMTDKYQISIAIKINKYFSNKALESLIVLKRFHPLLNRSNESLEHLLNLI